MQGLVSTHTVLGVRDGEFVSLIDPPEPYRELAAACRNVGCWPVLVGDEGDSDTMLSAPIILYDYPADRPREPRRPLRRHRDRRDPHAPDHDPDRRGKGGDGRRGRAGPRASWPAPKSLGARAAMLGAARDVPGAPARCSGRSRSWITGTRPSNQPRLETHPRRRSRLHAWAIACGSGRWAMPTSSTWP